MVPPHRVTIGYRRTLLERLGAQIHCVCFYRLPLCYLPLHPLPALFPRDPLRFLSLFNEPPPLSARTRPPGGVCVFIVLKRARTLLLFPMMLYFSLPPPPRLFIQLPVS